MAVCAARASIAYCNVSPPSYLTIPAVYTHTHGDTYSDMCERINS